MAVRVIDFPSNELPRVETGAVQFGTDWPGLFVRGDEAIWLAWRIECLEPILCKMLETGAELDEGDGVARERVEAGLSALAELRRVIQEEVQVR